MSHYPSLQLHQDTAYYAMHTITHYAIFLRCVIYARPNPFTYLGTHSSAATVRDQNTHCYPHARIYYPPTVVHPQNTQHNGVSLSPLYYNTD